MKPVTYHPLHRNRHRARPYFVLSIVAFILMVLLSLVKPVTDEVFNEPASVAEMEE